MVLISEPDSGIYDALNKGIQMATGEVIGFVHIDDFLANNEVVKLIATECADPAVEAVFINLDYIAQNDTSRVIRHWVRSDFTTRKLRSGWMPAHPMLYVRRHVYERLGGFATSFHIASDYDFILRFVSQTTARTVFIPEVLYKMRVGVASNRNLARIVEKTGEDRRALKKNGIGGARTIAWKNLSKTSQFFPTAK
jgi:glycosyltransferase